MYKFCYSIVVSFVLVVLIACNSPYTYKRKGYFKVDFPEKEYATFNQEGFPYSFQYPKYAVISRDSSFFNDAPENPWWLNIDVPQLNGTIYLSYKKIGQGKNNFDSLISDAFKMAYRKHTDISTGIKDSLMLTAKGIEGVYFSLLGNTATANQFFLTDSVSHFLRGALYFDASPNEDSLSIVNEFLRKDINHLINTLQWK